MICIDLMQHTINKRTIQICNSMVIIINKCAMICKKNINDELHYIYASSVVPGKKACVENSP